MTPLKTLTILALLAATACAPMQAATVNNSTGSNANDPAHVVRNADDGWIAFSIPALEGTRSPCCWKGNWSGGNNFGCSLTREFSSYGTMSESPTVESLIAYTQVRDGHVEQLKIVGEHCPMDTAGQSVTYVSTSNDRSTIDWLGDLADEGVQHRIGHSAIWAMALHASPYAGDRLRDIARENRGEFSAEAVFWLGEARGEAGCDSLERLLDELPVGETRRRINFALSQNDSDRATRLLTGIARNDRDPEQRADALFWLAEEHPATARDLVLEVIDTEQDREVLERAVFAMSQLPDGVAGPMLLDLAKDESAPREARRQALFWLANSGDEASVIELTELLTR